MLITLLQRTPADRIASVAEEYVAASPIGTVLRSASVIAASLGAMHSLAGATTLLATTASPANVTVGATVQIGFTVTNTINIGSWKVTGAIPPGLVLKAVEGGNTLTGPGTLDATTPGTSDGYGGTTGGNTTTTPLLTGSPNQAGAYTFTLQAFEFGGLGGLASNTFSYTVNVASNGQTGTAPAFTTQPQSQTVNAGNNVTFTIAVSGSPAPTIQWQKNGVPIGGATATTFSVNGAQTADAGSYNAVATNSVGSATSDTATLTVSAATVTNPPVFTLQASSQTVANGSTVVFNAAATDATSYRWQHNGGDIAGATGALLVISNAGAADAGTYTVIAGNAAGSTTGTAASLTTATVSAADAGHIINLSVLTNSGTGDNVLNVGFAVGGAGTSGTKPLLVRVSGPTLNTLFHLDGTMPDPTVTVQPLGSNTIIASNDDWSGNANVTATASAVGAFPFTDATSKDAALVTSLSSGAYAVLAAGKGTATGIVLTEIYDATPTATFVASTPRLINVSARAQVGGGSGILTAGFAIAGSTAKTVLIRATGPALAAFGLPGALADPKLELYILGGAKIYENDNWGGAATLTQIGQSVNAFGIQDTASRDAVLLVTLPPGTYAAQCSGVGGATGIALIEVYEVP